MHETGGEGTPKTVCKDIERVIPRCKPQKTPQTNETIHAPSIIRGGQGHGSRSQYMRFHLSHLRDEACTYHEHILGLPNNYVNGSTLDLPSPPPTQPSIPNQSQQGNSKVQTTNNPSNNGNHSCISYRIGQPYNWDTLLCPEKRGKCSKGGNGVGDPMCNPLLTPNPGSRGFKGRYQGHQGTPVMGVCP